MSDEAETEGTADDEPRVGLSGASSAFQVLGNETRMRIIEGLIADDADGVVPVERGFSDLFERTDEATSAGFAYHLRQLVDQYVTKDEETEQYRLTYAGRRIARELAAGTYVESVDRSPVAIDDPCPFCAQESLEAETVDNVVTVGCTDCSIDLLSLPFPPGGHRTQAGEESFVDAFNRHHRQRVATMSTGCCPECGGAVATAVQPAVPPEAANVGSESEPETEDDAEVKDANEEEEDDPERVLVHLECDGCGYRVRVPATITVLDHPAVVSLYHDHGVDLRERPVWNVGDEWRETLLSTDPVAVRVSTRLGDDCLSLYVDGTGTVVHTERSSTGDTAREAGELGSEDANGHTPEDADVDA